LMLLCFQWGGFCLKETITSLYADSRQQLCSVELEGIYCNTSKNNILNSGLSLYLLPQELCVCLKYNLFIFPLIGHVT
jgi:hypothetical protein